MPQGMYPRCPQQFPVPFPENDAAAGCDKDALTGAQLFQHSRFALPETFFAFHVEYQADTGAGAVFQFVIAIQKLQFEHVRQALANGCFAGAHRADQEYIPFRPAHCISGCVQPLPNLGKIARIPGFPRGRIL